MRRVSLNARNALADASSGEIEVVLLRFTHPDLDGPLLFSTDNASKFSFDPPVYGTRSTWRSNGPVPEDYYWIIASAVLPSDMEDAPAAAQIVLENLDSRMVSVVRSFRTPASISLAVVMADSPDVIEQEFDGLLLTSSDVNAGEITLTLSREEIELDFFPSGRMTRDRFPGLYS